MMKRSNEFIYGMFLMMAVVLPFNSAAQSGVAPYSLNVKEFSELKVIDGVNVEYFCDASKAGTVEFESTPEVASAIIFEPNGKGKLEIKLASRDEKYENLPVVRVYSSFLTKVENSGDSTLNVVTVAPSASFEAKLVGNGKLMVGNIQSPRVQIKFITGKGKITAGGKCENLKITLAGTGEINAFDLEATDVECSLLGTGWIKCSASGNLKVSGAGTGTVTFKGNPITRVKALSVKVKRFEQ